jgi:hypothetical protein
MKKLISLLTVALVSITVLAQDAKLVLQDGTPIRLRTAENLSSHDAVTGETVDFEVMEDIYVNDVMVVKKGSFAIGTITAAQHKKNMGRQGKLDITIDYVRLLNGEKAQLRGTKQGSGGGHTGAMVGAMVATSLVIWPAAPLFLLMHGKDINIAKGTPITAYVDGDFSIGQVKARKTTVLQSEDSTEQPPTPAPAAAPVAPANPVTPAEVLSESGATKVQTISAARVQSATEPTAPATVVDNGGESLGDAAKRQKQLKACMDLAKNNPSIVCK